MIVYSPIISPRLRYAGDFVGQELFGQPLVYTTNIDSFSDAPGQKINYSRERISVDEYWIQPAGLLEQEGIHPQKIKIFQHNGIPAFFACEGDHGFDIFSAIFFLLSRYEEYLIHEKDLYGRYAHTNSLAYKEGFLPEPLVNLWIIQLKEVLEKKFPSTKFERPGSSFRFIPTYDIDEAWSFKNKSSLVSLGGMAKDLFKRKLSRINQRLKVRRCELTDPFDSYDWMDQLHTEFALEPRYFFLVAAKRSRYDRNNPVSHPAFIELVKRHASRYTIGIHPSWQAAEKNILKSEISFLERTAGQKIISSRQHFIRFAIPETFRDLLDSGIREDFSMGYGTINGFRASVASPFYWYDLEKEEQTALLLYPFCFMDANSFFEQKQNGEQALEEINSYYQKVKSVKGSFVCIWHNTFLGTDPLFKGWREVYERFITGIN